MKAGINATRELKVVDNSSSNGEPRTGIDDQAIWQEENDRNKAETSDVVSDLLGDSTHGARVGRRRGERVWSKSRDEIGQLEEAKLVRIKLLKAIVAINYRPAVAQPAPSLQPVPEPYKTTEYAALNRWSTLTALR
ncbi:hypothetical protein HOY80DRAFT_1041665 [Tuber brumale]|nr:hypothetical protein HOY80DRAFT_1041665 [Tuber brumale]